MKRIILSLAISTAFFIVGCSAEQIAQWNAMKQQAIAAERPATQAVADINAQVQDLPVNDPLRVAAGAKLAKLNATIAKADSVIQLADSVIDSITTGQQVSAAVTAAGNTVPIPYSGLITAAIVGIGGIIGTFHQAGQKKEAQAALVEVANDTAASVSDAPFSGATANQLAKLGVDTPGTAAAQATAKASS